MPAKRLFAAIVILAFSTLSCQLQKNMVAPTEHTSTQITTTSHPPSATPVIHTSTQASSQPRSNTPTTNDLETQAVDLKDITGVWLEKFAGGTAEINIMPDGVTFFTILSGTNKGYHDRSKSWFENDNLNVKTNGSQEIGIYKVFVTRRDGQAVELRYVPVKDPNVARLKSMTYAPLTRITPSFSPTPRPQAATSTPKVEPIPGIHLPLVIKNVSLKNSLGLLESVDIEFRIFEAMTSESLKSGEEIILPENKGNIFLNLKLSLGESPNAIGWVVLNVPVVCSNESYKARDTVTIEFGEGLLRNWQVHYEIPANTDFGTCSVKLPSGEKIPLGSFFGSPKPRATETISQIPTAIVFPPTIIPTYNPEAKLLSNSLIEPCRWDIRIVLTGFAPNTLITIESNYTELVCATGETVTNSWSDVYPGKTDKNGSLEISYLHEGTGSYSYTFIDEIGNRISLLVNTTP